MPTPPRSSAPRQASGNNAAAQQRRALRQALSEQSVRIATQERQITALRNHVASLTEAVRSAQRAEERNGAAVRTAVNRHAIALQALGVRHETAERQIVHLAAGTDKSSQVVAIGAEGLRRVSSLYRTANPANPAQPVYEPPSEPATESDAEAMLPVGPGQARGVVTELGAVPGTTDVAPDAVISVQEPYGMAAVTPVGLNRVDVTAPVAGTETATPPNQTIVPVDVRVGDPDNPQPAFPWDMGPVGAQSVPAMGPPVSSPPSAVPTEGDRREASADRATKRAFATLRLARLQIAAGLAEGDDLGVAADIDRSGLSNEHIATQISTLEAVAAASGRRVASGQRMPKVAALDPSVPRSVPSLVAPATRQSREISGSGVLSEDHVGFL